MPGKVALRDVEALLTLVFQELVAQELLPHVFLLELLHLTGEIKIVLLRVMLVRPGLVLIFHIGRNPQAARGALRGLLWRVRVLERQGEVPELAGGLGYAQLLLLLKWFVFGISPLAFLFTLIVGARAGCHRVPAVARFLDV